ARINVTGAGLPVESNECDGVDVAIETKIDKKKT
ncbi:unnamed protein product, partial [Rotaria magnacalcarata]